MAVTGRGGPCRDQEGCGEDHPEDQVLRRGRSTQPTMLGIVEIRVPPPNRFAATGSPMTASKASTIRPYTMPAASRPIPARRRRSRPTISAKTAPAPAPMARCTIIPISAGPAVNQKSCPAIACCIDVINAVGEMNVEAMWYSGVKKPTWW